MIRLIKSITIIISLLLPLFGQEKLIKSIKHAPEVIRAGVPLTFTPEMDAKFYREFTVTYHFYKNGSHLKESNAGTLFPKNYKKGDRIHVEVHLTNPDNGYLVEKAVSDKIRVNNTAPHITKLNLPDILRGGEIKFIVEAQDIDKDTLEFSIDGDKAPDYVSINETTGEVTMNMPTEFPSTIEFTIKVEDTSGSYSTQIVTFTKRKKEIEQNENS